MVSDRLAASGVVQVGQRRVDSAGVGVKVKAHVVQLLESVLFAFDVLFEFQDFRLVLLPFKKGSDLRPYLAQLVQDFLSDTNQSTKGTYLVSLVYPD